MPPRKEVHYFDMVTKDRTLTNHAIHLIQSAQQALRIDNKAVARENLEILSLNFKPPRAYVKYLTQNTSEKTKICGEITPSYSCLTRDGFALMKRLLNPRVVFIMRDPLDRFWSAIRMSSRDAIGDGTALESLLDSPGHWARSDYATTIQLLDDVFGPRNVLYLFYENLMSTASMTRLAGFLGINESWPYDLHHKSRVGRRLDAPNALYDVPLRKLQPIYRFVRERFGEEVPETWQSAP